MLSLAIVFALVGAVLGSRFRVMVLVPTIAVSLLVIAATNAAIGAGLWMAAIEVVIAIIAVQLGYLSGAAIRLFLATPHDAVRHTSTATRPIS